MLFSQEGTLFYKKKDGVHMAVEEAVQPRQALALSVGRVISADV